MKRLPLIALLAAAAAGISLSAQAQTTATPSTNSTSRCTEITAQANSHLAYLESKLAITSSEQSAWTAYASAVTSGAQAVSAVCLSLPSPPPTDAPTRFSDRLKMAAARVQSDQTVLPALQALYSALTPAQQAILNSPHGGGRFRGHR